MGFQDSAKVGVTLCWLYALTVSTPAAEREVTRSFTRAQVTPASKNHWSSSDICSINSAVL